MRGIQFPLSFLLLLFIAAAAEVPAATLYVDRVVFADPGDVRLADMVKVKGEVSEETRELLARSVAVLSRRFLLIPVQPYLDLLDESLGQGSIVVGSRSLLVPRGLIAEGLAQFFDSLLDFLLDQGAIGPEGSEIEIVQDRVTQKLPWDAVPVFQIVRNTKSEMNPRSTAAAMNPRSTAAALEISCSGTDSRGEATSGSIVLAVRQMTPAGLEGVKSSESVKVIFRKGPIQVEMEGKALASAKMGENVSVFVSESQKRFSGRVVGRKAVEVEIP